MTDWLLDTGPLVAFFDRSESTHDWVKAMWERAPVPMLTCDAVIAETAYLLTERAGLRPERILALFERKVLKSLFSIEDEASAVGRLLNRYHDQRMQIADACLVRMSEMHRDCRVFTLDQRDFSVYRRFERQIIPLVAPE